MKRTLVLTSALAITLVLTTTPLWGRGPAGGRGGYGGGGYGGFRGGEGGHGGFDGFHGGEEGRSTGGFGGAGANRYGGGAGRGTAANGSHYGNAQNLQGAANHLNNPNSAGSHAQQWQQHQPYNNWYQGHGNWGNSALTGVGAAAGLTAGAAALDATGMAGWGLGAGYYNSGYQPYYNPYYSGDDSGGGYDYSQPVQAVQYSVPSQSPQEGGGAPSNAPTASDEALRQAEMARRAFRNQDYTEALNEASQALKQMPGDPNLHEFRSLALFALAQYQPSAAAIHSVLAVGPGWNWTTMIGLYGHDPAKYTKQLRALETYSQSNPDASAAHFLLAYHYLTSSHTDDAEKELKKVVELTPKDEVAVQLLAVIGKPKAVGVAATRPAVAGSSEKPMTANTLVGDWTSRRDDGSTIQLRFPNDSKFTWTYTAGGKTKQFSGTAADANGLLALQGDEGTAMMARVTSVDAGSFRFRLVGGPPNDPGLIFAH